MMFLTWVKIWMDFVLFGRASAGVTILIASVERRYLESIPDVNQAVELSKFPFFSHSVQNKRRYCRHIYDVSMGLRLFLTGFNSTT